MKREIIIKFSECLASTTYRKISKESKIPMSTLTRSLKSRSANSQTLSRMVVFLEKKRAQKER